ncbi:Aste57867_22654 [Aphanomyces stellatus]|uniref:Aste57867_22654 protein n=1 Tax=Aphanomyces stellatus TaxID=120398 RepID=A0A485LL85_9STRA|nr:hypothetical protein As57867_022584 [Aphanomyces stellatus]VFT99308.1 Aste57867_22654 [Aphanomyces stellatus]
MCVSASSPRCINKPSSTSRRLSKSQREEARSISERSQSMGSITDLRRGKLAWEISFTDTSAYDPESSKLQLWGLALFVMVLYDVWAVPMLLCFNMMNPETCDQTSVATAAMAFEVFFLADIYVQMHTGYYILGNLVRHAVSARRRYVLSWSFLLDLVALVPVASTHACGLSLVNKLLVMHRIPSFALAFDKVFARHFKFCKVVKVVVLTCLFCHVMACVYAAFGKASDEHDDHDAWKIHDHSLPGHHQLLTTYFAALFWSLGMISKCLEGEIPCTLWQTVFTLVVMLGGFICRTLFMVSKCDANSVERFDAKLNQLRHVLSYHRVSKAIQNRAVEFLENGFKSGEKNVRNTMRLFCPSISKGMKYMFLKYDGQCAVLQLLPTNYIVCSADEEYEDMYFVQSGVLVIFNADVRVRDLRRGALFGELSLFSKQIRSPSGNTVAKITTLYNVYTVPLLNAFQLIGYLLIVILANTLTDAILWFDIYGHFNLSYMYEGEQIFDTQKCALQYFHSFFAFDLFCAFPWWIFFPTSWHLKVRFIRLFRFYRLNAELEEVALFVRINSRRQIVVLGIGLLFCYRIAGCMAQALALVMGYDDDEHGWLPTKSLQLVKIYSNTTGELTGYNWLNGIRFVTMGDTFVRDVIVKQYAGRIIWSCMPDKPRTNIRTNSLGEFVLAFVLMLCGMLLISAIIDEVQKRVTASAIEQMEFLATRSRILHFLKKYKSSTGYTSTSRRFLGVLVERALRCQYQYSVG